MSVHTTTAPVTRRPSRRFVAADAVLAAGATVIALSLTIGGGSGTSRLAPAAPAAPAATAPAWLMSLTPAQLASGALGLGYALPSTTNGPTTASVLASMSPQTRRYTRAVTSLTFGELAAGAAGSP